MMMNYLRLLYIYLVLQMLAVPSYGNLPQQMNLEFNNLTNRDGLSNAQVNCILQDNRGYMWFGTQSGLCRYDGFRFKNFFNKNLDEKTIPNNSVDEIQQDWKGNLWIHTSVGYCIYQYDKENFDRHPEKWLQKAGVTGSIYKVFIDSNKNFWFMLYEQGCCFVEGQSLKSHLFSYQDMGIKKGEIVSAITEQKGTAVLSFNNGTLCRIDGLKKKVLWTNPYLTQHEPNNNDGIFTFIDSRSNYWVLCNDEVYIYCSAQKKWYVGMHSFMSSQKIAMPTSEKVLIRDIATSMDGKTWIATDHLGLLVVDYAHRACHQYIKQNNKLSSLPDNSLQKVYIDRNQAVWIGTYKNGVAYNSPSFTKFNTIDLGDICTITQDQLGNYWCGTNDAGIVCYNPNTGLRVNYGMAQTGLKSNIVVSSITMSDGTMYFGTFNGGMVRYRNGEWKTYMASPHGLANQNVWAFGEDKYHRLLIGTLGGGVQIFDPKTEQFIKTLNTENSKIPSNYISAFSNLPSGNVLIGHSQNVSRLNIDNYSLINHRTTEGGLTFPSPSINDVIVDSRGICWMATPAGITMYDPNSGQLENVNELNGTQGAVGCAVVEDQQKTIWLISEFIVTHVQLAKNNKNKWELRMTSYNSMDGLQEHQFNYRSAYLSKNGDLVIGGQDGINIIHTKMERNANRHVQARFSGLVLFDHPLMAGEEYEGRVVLEESLDKSRELNLSYKDNAFTIQLSSSEVTVPSRNRFLYRMEGVNDKWIMTASGRPEVTFTNLSSGSYTLQVKVVNGDGTVCDDISELEINVAPPFYLSIWALMVYILLACGAVYVYRNRALERQKMVFERERMEANIKKDRELNELKLNFFTNVSHELRTPLTLIISPLISMIKKEEDEDKKRKLTMIHRNAERLLNLVNQILDFRKIEQNRGKLTLTQVEVVSFVENICHSFQVLGNNKIQLSFTSTFEKLHMSFDVDKVGKILNNLLSNAYKFTPEGGSVMVTLDRVEQVKINGVAKDMLRMKVADTGKGISDEDKQHIFDRFFQVNGTEMQPFGGSGIGLNLVKSFADLHGGTATVEDNPGGGTVFTIDIPLQQGEMKVEGAASVSTVVRTSTPSPQGDLTQQALASSEKLHVLLVDDSDDFREFMTEILSENYIVEQAVNGKEGWDKLQEDTLPDIILSDVMMPEMDGNEFCRLVKETPRTANIPFVMLTARLATEHRKEGFENGADEYITKPFDIDLLNLRIRNLVKWAQRSTDKEEEPQAKANHWSHPDLIPADAPSLRPGHEGENTEQSQAAPAVEEYVMTESDKRFIHDIDIYIRDNMGDPDTTVESMSAHLCISRVQLYKRMVSLTGTTPSEYLRAKRIHRAEELLCTGEYTVSEIAYKVGFNNPRYFSKYFQEAYGMTPSQYKKEHQR